MTKDFERELTAKEAAVPTSRLGRLWRMGSAAARVGAGVLGQGVSRAQSEAIARTLGELKGLAMKAGQMMSYVDAAVPAELQATLTVLQQAAQATPWGEVSAQLRASLPAQADALLAQLDPQPVAVASIGQVHRGRLPDGTEVAVKVRHPGIERALEGDFRTAASGTMLASFLLPAGVTVDGFVREARTMFLSECDYTLEAQRQARFHTLFAGDPALRVPRVFRDFSSDAVLTTEWLSGQRFEDFRTSGTAEARSRAGEAMFRFHIGALYAHHLFHADPHPGNYAFSEAGSVVVYDFGCVREFPRPIVQALARCADAVRRDALPEAFAALGVVGATPPTEPEEHAVLRELLRGFFAPLLTPGRHRIELGAFTGARELLADKRRLMRLQLPSEMLFLFRLRYGLFAVLHHLGAEADWAALEAKWAASLLAS